MDLLDLCAVLGVQPGASVAEVKAAYRDLAQVWHPDRFGQNVRLNTLATEKLKEINAAHFQLMELARPSGYVPTPTRTVEQTSPTTPPPPQPEAARPRPQPSSPPPDPQPPTPESQTKQSKATRRKVKQIKMYRRVGPYIFVIVTTLAVASIAWMMVNRGIDYYPGEHPAILCDGWHYEGGPDAGMTLSENGQATFYHAGKVEYEAHWICKEGTLYVTPTNSETSIFFTDFHFDKERHLVGTYPTSGDEKSGVLIFTRGQAIQY